MLEIIPDTLEIIRFERRRISSHFTYPCIRAIVHPRTRFLVKENRNPVSDVFPADLAIWILIAGKVNVVAITPNELPRHIFELIS
jgi:hypothetical protein